MNNIKVDTVLNEYPGEVTKTNFVQPGLELVTHYLLQYGLLQTLKGLRSSKHAIWSLLEARSAL